MSSKKTGKDKHQSEKSTPPTPAATRKEASGKTDPPKAGAVLDREVVDFDEFLSDVTEDIEHFEERFQTNEGDEEDSIGVETDDAGLEFEEWILPEEAEDTDGKGAPAPVKLPDQKPPAKKAVHKTTAQPEGISAAPKKSTSPKTVEKKKSTLIQSASSPATGKKPAPTPKRPVKPTPAPPASPPGPEIERTVRVAPEATPKVKSASHPAPPPPQFKNLDDSEDVIAQHLVDELPPVYEEPRVDETHRRSGKPASRKFIVGAGLTVLLLLTAALFYLQDPFGITTPKSPSTSVSRQSAPPKPVPPAAVKVPAPPAAVKVPATPPSTPAKKQTAETVSQEKQVTMPEKTPPLKSPDPEPAPVVAQAAPPKPQPEVIKEPPQARPEITEAPPPQTQVQEKAPRPPPESGSVPRNENVRKFLDKWASAWEKTAGPDGEFTAYMDCYSDRFMARGMDKAAWRQDKQAKNSRKKWIAISIRNISVKELPRQDLLQVSFSQGYRSSNYSSTSPKTLVLAKEAGGWKIIGINP